MATTPNNRNRFGAAILLSLATFAVSGSRARAVEIPGLAESRKSVVDSVMELDPELSVPDAVFRISPKLKPLWLKVLAQPEADLQRQAADALARAARLGLRGMSDAVPPLVKVLDADDARPFVRRSAAAALIAIDAKQSAPSLFKHLSSEGVAYAQIVEPALARWDYRPMRGIWIARLTDRRTRKGLMLLAIRGLTDVKETDAAEKLWALVERESVPPQIRLEAARAVGRLRATGQLDRAKSLAADKSPQKLIHRLAAASLLARHSGERVHQLLRELALDREPAVAAIALERLLEIDTRLVLPIVDRLLPNPDAKVRLLAAAAPAADPSPTSIKKLGPLFNDPHPGNRAFVRETFRRFAAKPALDPLIRSEAVRHLQLDNWRGQEQAALLLTLLDHKPAAKRLVALLESRRPEVIVATGWALRKLAVRETLPAMLDRCIRATAANRGKNAEKALSLDQQDAVNAQVAQLFQAFGQMKYTQAASFLRGCVPKNAPYSPDVRAAAIWTLGFIEPPSLRPALAKQLDGRLADAFGRFPEHELVRRMSAVTLGRFKAKQHLTTLRRFYEGETPQTKVGLACRWAIREITGEVLPGPIVKKRFVTNWFIEPLEAPVPDKK